MDGARVPKEDRAGLGGQRQRLEGVPVGHFLRLEDVEIRHCHLLLL